MNRNPGAREPQDGRLNESMGVLAFETPWSFCVTLPEGGRN